jgi:hypothetical protein
MSESIAYSAQDRMDEEINQTIRTCDQLTKEELFEYLTDWIQYLESYLKAPQKLEQLISQYNEKRLLEYHKLVDLAEQKFKETEQYKTLDNLDFYEVKYVGFPIIGAMHRDESQKRLVQYRRFFEVPDPDLIDIDYLNNYLEVARPIILRCINIAKKRLSYLKGENETKELPASLSKPTNLLPATTIKSNKLKVRLTVEQLTVLFRLLKDSKLIDAKYDKEIHSFVADNFETVGLGGKSISAKNVAKLFSSTDTSVLNFWIAKFKTISEIAQDK